MSQRYEDFLQESLDKCTFEDVFDVGEIQKLQDEFAYSMQIASIITDLEGKPITKPSNFCALCEEYIRTSEKGLQKCMNSDSVIGNENVNGYTISKCLSAGLMDGGVSIVIGDTHIANWLFGQVRDENEVLDERELTLKAGELGIDPECFIKHYKATPVIPMKRFEHIAKFICLVCEKLSIQGYQKCVQEADAKYRTMIEEEMSREKKRLEYENTTDLLTKLYNRNYFENQLEKFQLLELTPIAIVMGDVNHLKLTNDLFGHRHGDFLLQTIAQVMLEESFNGYIVGRCGGDEFNVLIPNGRRQDAEWYCHRIQTELQKRFDCCVLPSIAFGIGKKSNKGENLKTIRELADMKMYRAKTEMKEKEDIVEDMHKVLLGRGFLTSELMKRFYEITKAFGILLGYNEKKLKLLTRLARMQDYGYIILNKGLFEKRMGTELTYEERREIRKHPVIGSKIAGLNEIYAEVSNFILASHEHWDGSGYPNALKGTDIPEISRVIRIIDDYILGTEKPPIGMNLSKEEAISRIQQGLGKKYDPDLAERFLTHIENIECGMKL